MKKYISLAILVCMYWHISSAQVQRTPVKQQNDSSAVVLSSDKNKDSRKEIFRELDLTREQRAKMKEISQSMKASKEAIEADTTLSEPEKKAKLKVLRKEQAQKIQSLLTEEQKVKFRELKTRKEVE